MSSGDFDLANKKVILVHQIHELAEWLGFETRNKYEILDENRSPIGFAAEQQKGIFGFFMRQYFGHWRKFDVHFFDVQRRLAFVGHHPFRWFFQRIEVQDPMGFHMGAIQKRFSFLSKRFDVENSREEVIMEVSSPIWRIWTFTFMYQGRPVAQVKKKWSGILFEGFTDRDNFIVEFIASNILVEEKTLVMAAAVFIDLLYFERKAK